MGSRASDVAQLLTAAATGQVEQIERLLANGLDVESADYDGRRAMHIACAEGQAHIVQALLQHGASIGAEDRWGNTPLSESARHGHTQLVDLLRAAQGAVTAADGTHGDGGSGSEEMRALVATVDGLQREKASLEERLQRAASRVEEMEEYMSSARTAAAAEASAEAARAEAALRSEHAAALAACKDEAKGATAKLEAQLGEARREVQALKQPRTQQPQTTTPPPAQMLFAMLSTANRLPYFCVSFRVTSPQSPSQRYTHVVLVAAPVASAAATAPERPGSLLGTTSRIPIEDRRVAKCHSSHRHCEVLRTAEPALGHCAVHFSSATALQAHCR